MSFTNLVYNTVTGKHEPEYPSTGTTNPFVSESGTQTLTNKTLTAPAISSPVLSGTPTGSLTGAALTSPVLTTPLGAVTCLETLFTQTAATATHTATFPIPAGATILDIWVTNSVVWNSGTTAVLNIGLVDTDCFFAAIDLKTVPAAGKSMNLAFPGASNGGASVPEIDAGAGNTQLGATNGLFYNAAAQSLTAVVVDTNVSGTNGRTRVTVLYSLPSAIIAPVVT